MFNEYKKLEEKILNLHLKYFSNKNFVYVDSETTLSILEREMDSMKSTMRELYEMLFVKYNISENIFMHYDISDDVYESDVQKLDRLMKELNEKSK